MAFKSILLFISIILSCQVLAVPVIQPNEVDIDINVDPSAYGVPVTELDILVDTKQAKRSTDDKFLGNVVKRNADFSKSPRWTDNTLVYKIKEDDFNAREIQIIMEGMADFEKHTCIKFRKAQSFDKNFVHIMNGAGCASFLGMTGGEQPLYLANGCRHVGIVVHELGHALGFYHEHNRPDRDRYIKVHLNNMESDKQHSVIKQSYYPLDTYRTEYDYLSIMHYGTHAFSINGKPTLELLKNKSFKDAMGQRYGLSFLDIVLANQMYKCTAHCPSIKCHASSQIGKDCTCQCPDYKLIRNDPFIFHITAAPCDIYGSII